MVHIQEHQKAAGKYVRDYVSIDEEMREEKLVHDELFSTIALCRYQIDLYTIGDEGMTESIQDDMDVAHDALKRAMDQRAEQILDDHE